ncbi:MAG: protein kinase [Myxococcales bacterium]|nr:protein kinase [Myxococcales bacterium]
MSSSAIPLQTLGKYHLIAELGHGGMADVYLAVARGPAGFSKLQVVKQLRPALAENPEIVAMFLDEARLAARLNHPNVVQTHEVVQEGDHCFLAMEYFEGQPLDRIMFSLSSSDVASTPAPSSSTLPPTSSEGKKEPHLGPRFPGKAPPSNVGALPTPAPTQTTQDLPLPTRQKPTREIDKDDPWK